MTDDLNMAILLATFKVEQMQTTGLKTVGTAWLVNMSQDNEGQKIALVTANHVLARMEKAIMSIHWRRIDEEGFWHREPQDIRIRNDDLTPLWLKHPERDIAVMWIDAPNGVRENAISFDNIADEKALKTLDVGMGDELLALGYPKGLSANELGFPILRSGRVASYPIWPVKSFPSFLMDFAVFAGNSGGPVYMSDRLRKRSKLNRLHEAHFIAGILAQQVNLDEERLEIGIVLHASFIRDILLELLGDDHEDNIA